MYTHRPVTCCIVAESGWEEQGGREDNLAEDHADANDKLRPRNRVARQDRDPLRLPLGKGERGQDWRLCSQSRTSWMAACKIVSTLGNAEDSAGFEAGIGQGAAQTRSARNEEMR